jgi:hypothetical protein
MRDFQLTSGMLRSSDIILMIIPSESVSPQEIQPLDQQVSPLGNPTHPLLPGQFTVFASTVCGLDRDPGIGAALSEPEVRPNRHRKLGDRTTGSMVGKKSTYTLAVLTHLVLAMRANARACCSV